MRPVAVQLHWSDGEVYPPIKFTASTRPGTVDVYLTNMLSERTYRGGYSLRFKMADGSIVTAKPKGMQ